MPSLRLAAALLLSLFVLTDCARRPAPVVETVRTEDSPTPPAAARDLADVMASTLSLSPEQTTKVRSILANTVAEVNAARQKHPPKSAPLMTELKRINASSEAQLKQTLGAVKYKEFQAKKKQIQTEMQQRAR
ncbi:hypothetical protein GCM10023185_27930 [Hymenobacter saemangeumensis]|uniref:DUF4890 domain-containing protein n=1 Tax=Hymenobacter saemangeumensis TaxID=1084522 RepID=A0ABP8IK10_9BACT